MSKLCKKINVLKKILGKIFKNFFSLNLIFLYILNYFYHFQPFSYYKKCAYLKEVIRRDFDQCESAPNPIILSFFYGSMCGSQVAVVLNRVFMC